MRRATLRRTAAAEAPAGGPEDSAGSQGPAARPDPGVSPQRSRGRLWSALRQPGRGQLIAAVMLFIVGLGGMLAFRGVLLGITGGTTIAPVSPSLVYIGQGYLPHSVGTGLGILLLALTLFPELLFAAFLNVVFVKGILDISLGRKAGWKHLDRSTALSLDHEHDPDYDSTSEPDRAMVA